MKHLLLVLTVLCTGLFDRLRGRRVAANAALLPIESSRGTETLTPDAVIGFDNAVVKSGSDDRHFTLPAAAADIPRGILLNDQVSAGDLGAIPKQVALFGLYPETLPGVAAGVIAVGAEVVADLTTPGRVRQLPATTGSYVVFGRARFAVAAAGDPVSIIHTVPRTVAIP